MTYRVVDDGPEPKEDLRSFLDHLNLLHQSSDPVHRRLFELDGPDLVCARAPGRLDVMGGIADYSGSLVLEWPLREAAYAAVQRTQDREVRIVSRGRGDGTRADDFVLSLDALESDGGLIGDAEACALFRRDPSRRWAAYVVGAFVVLAREGILPLHDGARIFLDSAVPEGKGVSSSAAIEVATMAAICAAHDLTVDPRRLALLCQRVENTIAGAPCGVMDQMTAACGEENRLLALLCQPAELRATIEVPDGAALFGIDSGIRHAVSGSDYGTVRTGAFMGYRMMAEQFGLAVRPGQPLAIDDPRWDGYLANVDPTEFEEQLRNLLPERLDGKSFLARYGGTTDPVTTVEADRDYPVLHATSHPVHEHARVTRFAELLGRLVSNENLTKLGELMYASHDSYSRCGLGSDGTDLLVDLVRQAGSDRGLFGAKITGGGSGGTVAVLGSSDAFDAVEEIAAEYRRKTGRDPYLFRGSSPGAVAFGSFRLSRS